MFICHVSPELLVSDNQLQFVSLELKTFMKMNGACHIKSAPSQLATA